MQALLTNLRGVRQATTYLLLLGAINSFAVELPTTTPLPIIAGTKETRSTPFIAWFEDLSGSNYVEREYLISGDANVYEYVDNAAQSTKVRVRQADIPYTSRILVRRPVSARQFNGTVYLEVLNPTAGWDGDPIWQNTHGYLIRAGAAYVGLTSKPLAVTFLRDKWGATAGSAARNNARYAPLNMPHFGLIWDMLSQLAALLKSPDSSDNPLTGLDVERIILTGYSQSVAFQVTYANSFHADALTPAGRPLIDGYYLAAGGAAAKNVNRPTLEDESLPDGDPRNRVAVNVPVVRFQTQTEVINFASHTVRQLEPASPLIRTYEMAGGAHVDLATNGTGGKSLTRDLGLPNFGAACELPLNPIRIGFVQSALLEVTDQWVRGNALPPHSRMMSLVTDSKGVKAIELDAVGNAIGGLRPPRLEVPLGTYFPTNSGEGFCFLFGGFRAFDEVELKRRYPNHQHHVEQLGRQIERAVSERFLLQSDAEILRTLAAKDSG